MSPVVSPPTSTEHGEVVSPPPLVVSLPSTAPDSDTIATVEEVPHVITVKLTVAGHDTTTVTTHTSTPLVSPQLSTVFPN